MPNHTAIGSDVPSQSRWCKRKTLIFLMIIRKKARKKAARV